MSLLVTGANGFIGTRLCQYLSHQGIDFEAFTGNLLDISSFNPGQFETIIHLAALISHLGNWSDKEMATVNIDGTDRLCKRYSTAKMIFISTVDVARPVLTAYAKTKLQAEAIVAKNPDNLIIRLPSVFGPNQKQDKLIPRLIRHFFNDEPCTITNDDTRQYIFVDDVASEIVENIKKNGLITLNGTSISNRRLESFIRNIAERTPRPDMTDTEKRFYRQLEKCCQAYQEKLAKEQNGS